MSSPDQAMIDHWHRWFAVELNNRAWELAEQASRTGDEEQQMIAAAYGATFHWAQVGTVVNAARAEVLLGHVHSLLGRGDDALRHARRALSLCEENGFDDWDLASAHIEMARGAAAANDHTLHQQHLEKARTATAAIRDDEDRVIMARLLASVPT